MTPPRYEIEAVIARTGMGYLQALRHCQQRAQLVRAQGCRRMK